MTVKNITNNAIAKIPQDRPAVPRFSNLSFHF
jgi:hypothetical protein